MAWHGVTQKTYGVFRRNLRDLVQQGRAEIGKNQTVRNARPHGTVAAGEGWTDLVLGPDRPARVVTGLVTGWHEPQASHLLLLEAVAGAELVQRAYDAAIDRRYLWHEFGDTCLLLA